VVQDDAILEVSRSNYRLCKDNGLELHRTDMRG
jgi:DNA polymerase-3 subunit chi